jgi:hypothetical protein
MLEAQQRDGIRLPRRLDFAQPKGISFWPIQKLATLIQIPPMA